MRCKFYVESFELLPKRNFYTHRRYFNCICMNVFIQSVFSMSRYKCSLTMLLVVYHDFNCPNLQSFLFHPMFIKPSEFLILMRMRKKLNIHKNRSVVVKTYQTQQLPYVYCSEKWTEISWSPKGRGVLPKHFLIPRKNMMPELSRAL